MATKTKPIEPDRIYNALEAASTVGGTCSSDRIVAAVNAGELAGSNLGGPTGVRVTGRALLAWIDGGNASVKSGGL